MAKVTDWELVYLFRQLIKLLNGTQRQIVLAVIKEILKRLQ